MLEAPGSARMTEDGGDGFQLPSLGGTAELEQAMLADKPLAGPGAIAHKVNAALSGCPREFG